MTPSVGMNRGEKQIPTRILAAARLRMARNDKVVGVEEIRARFPSPVSSGQALRASSPLRGGGWLGMTMWLVFLLFQRHPPPSYLMLLA